MTAFIKSKKGNLYVVLRYNLNGEWKQKWISTGLKDKGNRNQLKQRLDDYIREYAYLESVTEREDMYFIPFMRKWCERHKPEVQPNSYESMVTNINAHIAPYFEKHNYRLDDITLLMISNFYDHLTTQGNRRTGGGLGTKSIKKISSILKQCFNAALVLGIVKSNPAAVVKVPKIKNVKAVKYVYMNKTEANKVIKAFDGHQLKPLVFMTLFYGLRRSEVIGLKWENIDFENSTELNRYPAFGPRYEEALTSKGESPFLATKTYPVTFYDARERESKESSSLSEAVAAKEPPKENEAQSIGYRFYR